MTTTTHTPGSQLDPHAPTRDPTPAVTTVKGMLVVTPEGFGFLRTAGYIEDRNDVFVPARLIAAHGLRPGDLVEGPIKPKRSKDKFPALTKVAILNGTVFEKPTSRPRFADLIPVFPNEKLRLADPSSAPGLLPRMVDLLTPIGKGQRALIVSPPKAGKTTILKELAHAVEANNPECYTMTVLIDERPEEVTDMKRSVRGEVLASTFDRPATEHIQLAELAIERAKRLVEYGMDVVLFLDSITRLARAYNMAAPTSGRILSGGVDATALYPPKRFFGAARNIEGGGSLTIVATALVETGSRMDDVIFEEFKGTGNMELRLSRALADKRVYPAIDIPPSGTRHEELLMTATDLASTWKLRRVLLALDTQPALELLIDRLKHSPSNTEFLASITNGST